MFGKLLGRFRRNSKNSSPSSKPQMKPLDFDDDDDYDEEGELNYKCSSEEILVIKLTSDEGRKYRDLMRMEDINHSIIMGGYLRWRDIVSCMRVCKEWKEIIDCNAAYNMFLQKVLKSLEDCYPVCVNLSGNMKRSHVVGKGLKSLQEFVSFSKYSMRWLESSRFGYNNGITQSSTTMLLDFMSIDPKKIGHKQFHEDIKVIIPDQLAEKDPWYSLTSPLWNIDEDESFGIFMAFQSRFQYRFSFISLAYLRGEFYKAIPQSKEITKNISVKGEYEVDEPETPIGRYRASSSKEFSASSVSQFILEELTEDFAHDRFYDEEETVEAEAKVTLEFNSGLRKMLFKIWKSGLLNYAPVRNYVFQLLYLLENRKLYDFHRFHFHDNMKDTNVSETVQAFLSSEKGDSETFYTYLDVKKPCSGYSGGQSNTFYFVALTLKHSPTHADECEFEYALLQYYHYTVRGMALS